ncbi:MAG TPA: DUF1963 domain-containing protein [Vineibacter sp.]|nr:DUF1963 domain-containing protein [Vineibacter sp.]
MRSLRAREASDLLSAADLRFLAAMPGRTKAALLIEAADTAATCQEDWGLNIYGNIVLHVCCDCVARHLMRTGVSLSDEEAARLIRAYARRLDGMGSAFGVARHDDGHLQEGRHLFLTTVAPRVRRKLFLVGRLLAAPKAYDALLAGAAQVRRPPQEQAALRAVLEPGWTGAPLPPPPPPAPPPPPRDPRRGQVARPDHFSDETWEAAWRYFEAGHRITARAARMPPQDEAGWVIQDALEPEVETPLSDDAIAALYDAAAVPAIWWHRVRPVRGRMDATSYLGGLPRLTPDLDWPRRQCDGTALPLGAQIDCAQIPGFPGSAALPRTGTLYFFIDVHVDDDFGWGQVLYSPIATGSLKVSPLPDNPRRFHDPNYDVSGEKDWIDPRRMPERVGSVFDQWQIEPLVVGTHGAEASGSIMRQLYRGHDAEKVSKSGHQLDRLRSTIRRRLQARALGRAIPDAPSIDGDALSGYPWTWLYVVIHAERVARSARYHLPGFTDPKWARQPPVLPAALEVLLATIEQEADARFLRALEHAPEEKLSSDERRAFLAWLDSVEARFAPMREWQDAKRFNAGYFTQRVATLGARHLIAILPDGSSVLPPVWWELARHGADACVYDRHQMLGHGHGGLGSKDWLAKDHVMLMQIAHDDGINWNWDCGVLQFWIKPADLAARRFGDVHVVLVGN